MFASFPRAKRCIMFLILIIFTRLSFVQNLVTRGHLAMCEQSEA